MSSVRGMLLLWLLPGFAVICFLGGVTLYQSEKARMEVDLKSELGELSVVGRNALIPVRPRGPRPPRILDVDGQEEADPLSLILAAFSDRDSGKYFQQWNEDGDVMRRSNSLRGRNLSIPEADSRASEEYEEFLDDGERVFSRKVRMGPRYDPERGTVVFAISCGDLDEQLELFGRKLVGGGVVCCFALSGLLVIASRFALKPVEEIGRRASKLSADSLHERFRVDVLPMELRPIANRLNDLMNRLEDSFVRERRFSSDLAHEIRTPLASILSMAEVAAKWPDDQSVEGFEEIANVAKKMKSTVNSLLMLARLEGKVGQPERELIGLKGIVSESLRLREALIDERSLKLSVEADEEVEVLADPVLMDSIVSNLLGNALLYAPSGTLVRIIIGGEGVLLRVLNDAPDLNEDDVQVMFDRLWRHDKARSDDSHVGLGLSIAKRCAEVLDLSLKASLVDGVLEMQLSG
ncbi:histidine kinase dimerization/phospho-acceptor domain-containing protein [Pelagicoccus mobilis]|uniref:histidine kinase n=1 Tax=Pelagicoccus mobilis TaxID=415221 RepID=A0A934RV21_9BACT|nr:histidine kinase dimerization/phospho-acceptor domain-containing protein [Pelagicoccus mobilis]MBK1875955.1 hypothetical protein [Pelagicoccus mobilis]